MEKFPEIHDLTHKIVLAGGACKQDVHRADGLKLVELVNRSAEIYWPTKDIKTIRKPCPYPPNIEVGYPVILPTDRAGGRGRATWLAFAAAMGRC